MVILRIHDLISQLYEAPFPGDNGPSAIRGFEDALQNPETRYGKWPNDFDLLQVGHYEANSPDIVADHPHIRLAQGRNIISALAQEDTRQDLKAAEEKKLQPAPIRN